MHQPRRADPLLPLLLGCGAVVPVLYFGMQAFAAPFFPDFSILRITASELGSDRSPMATAFNWGIRIQGVAALLASFGFLIAFLRSGVHPVFAALAAAAVLMNGVQSLWAASYPLPDPRHGGHPLFVAAMLALPPLLAITMWRASCGGWARWYFVANLAALALIAPFMSGATGLDLNAYRGLLQRLFALTLFVPIGVGALVLARRLVPKTDMNSKPSGAMANSR